MRSFKRLTIGEEKEICKMYEELKNSTLISEKFKRTRTFVWKVLKRNGYKAPKKLGTHKFLKCDDNYFDNIDTPDKAYFLGLIVADGSVSDRSLNICLQEQDKQILEIFKEKIKFSGKLHYVKKLNKNHSNCYSITIYSRKIVEDLNKLGVVKNKTYKTYFPNIAEEFHSHFIRGVFDGDGHIGGETKAKRFTITGNKLLIEKIRDILYKKLQIFKASISFKSKTVKTSVSFRYSKDEDLLKIKDFLYKNCENFFIKRKKEKFDNFQYKIKLKNCKICGEKVHAKNLCKNHYQNLRYKKIKESFNLNG